MIKQNLEITEIRGEAYTVNIATPARALAVLNMLTDSSMNLRFQLNDGSEFTISREDEPEMFFLLSSISTQVADVINSHPLNSASQFTIPEFDSRNDIIDYTVGVSDLDNSDYPKDVQLSEVVGGINASKERVGLPKLVSATSETREKFTLIFNKVFPSRIEDTSGTASIPSMPKLDENSLLGGDEFGVPPVSTTIEIVEDDLFQGFEGGEEADFFAGNEDPTRKMRTEPELSPVKIPRTSDGQPVRDGNTVEVPVEGGGTLTQGQRLGTGAIQPLDEDLEKL